MNIETREFEVRLNEDTRTIVGLAVPFNQTVNVGGYKERFAPGAIPAVNDVKLFYSHSEPIGKVVRGEDIEDGYEIEAVISDTPRGNEVYTLLRDGVLNRFSVGFVPVEQDNDEGVVVRTKVDLREVSVVAFPAYAGAEITQVREQDSKENTIMENEIRDEVRALNDEIADLKRTVSSIHVPTTAEARELFRSQGEYAKALATGDDKAIALFRDVAVMTDSVVKDAWVGEKLRLIDHGRPSLNAFARKALPASGMKIEYAKVTSNTVDVKEQAAELDSLQYGEVHIDTETATVKTYGGYTEMSRQVIERSSVSYLDTVFSAMTLAYAKRMNAEFVGVIEGLSLGTVDVSAGTAAAWIEGVAQAASDIYEDSALSADFILCAPDVFVKIVSLVDSNDRPLVVANSPSNTIGSGSASGLNANLLGLPVIVDPALTAGKAFIANRNAIETYESAGAPARLQDEDVTVLSKAFSVYGYAAIAPVWTDAVVEVVTEAGS